MSFDRSIARAKAALNKRSSMKKSVRREFDLKKGCHDAMFHHAAHSEAARQGGDVEAAKKHMFMMLRHALERARSAKTASDMLSTLQRNISHFSSEACSEIGYSYGDSTDAKVKHFREKRGYVPHKDDKSFVEDYEKKSGPKL